MMIRDGLMALAGAVLLASACITVKGYYGDRSEAPPDAGAARDGFITGATDDGPIGSPEGRHCQPRLVRTVAEARFQQPDTPPPTCVLDGSGAATMRYPTVAGCPMYSDNQRPYRACYFGQNEDVSAFQRGHGLFEARYCFDGPLYEDLNLWFDTQGEPSTSLTFIRLHKEDDATPRSCRVALFSADESCVSEGKCQQRCSDTANPDGGSAPADDGGAPQALACSQFARVKIRMTTEWCKCGSHSCDRPATAEVRLLSLTYYPDDCLCSDDSQCQPGTSCRKDALSPEASCWKDPAGCKGVCLP